MTLIKSSEPRDAHETSIFFALCVFLLARASGTLPCYPSTRNTEQFNKQAAAAVISRDTRYRECHPSRDAAKRHYVAALGISASSRYLIFQLPSFRLLWQTRFNDLNFTRESTNLRISSSLSAVTLVWRILEVTFKYRARYVIKALAGI